MESTNQNVFNLYNNNLGCRFDENDRIYEI